MTAGDHRAYYDDEMAARTNARGEDEKYYNAFNKENRISIRFPNSCCPQDVTVSRASRVLYAQTTVSVFFFSPGDQTLFRVRSLAR